MHTIEKQQHLDGLWVVGVNYKKSDASTRGLFAINNEQYDRLLSIASEYGINDLFVVSTCNRTEIYGFADNARQLAALVCTVCMGDIATFNSMAYVKKGSEAITHLYHVAAGLDSQILGDYEILGQIKNAVKYAKGKGFIGTFLERWVNSVLQASKAVKTHTELSGGTVSVSFAAIQYVREYLETKQNEKELQAHKIVLLGTGKIGRVTCRNLVDYVHTTNVTLINRTEATASGLAGELGLRSAPLEALTQELADASVILVSTNAMSPVIRKEHLQGAGDKLIVDISVPCNVAGDVLSLPGITFVDVDMLSKIKDETLQKRESEVPKAIAIIDEHVEEFKEWYHMRRYVPVLREVKAKLRDIPMDLVLLKHAHGADAHDQKIQKVINTMATKMRGAHAPGCHYIQAINDLIA